MYVNLSSMCISDASRFLDPFFSKVNISQVTFVYPFLYETSFIPNLCALLHKDLLFFVIRELNVDFVSCTFVFNCTFSTFETLLKQYTKLLSKKLGKEVSIYV